MLTPKSHRSQFGVGLVPFVIVETNVFTYENASLRISFMLYAVDALSFEK